MDIAACKLCDEPRHGLVGQLLVCAGLMEQHKKQQAEMQLRKGDKWQDNTALSQLVLQKGGRRVGE